MRGLSENYIHDLKSGFLSGLVEHVHQDSDLDFQIRENFINIYFKGNSLLRLEEARHHRYRVKIDMKFTGNVKYPDITDQATARLFLDKIPSLKENILRHGKSSIEIEYEQMIIRANNYEPRNNSDYFIVDRQITEEKEGRFDMIGFYWPRGRKRGQVVPICLFEVKYAQNPDIQKVHEQLSRYYEAIMDRAPDVADQIQKIFQQKLELGLFTSQSGLIEALKTLRFTRDIETFQFILILVDHNPYSSLYHEEELKQLPFARQLRVMHTGFAMWGNNLKPINPLVGTPPPA